jgi:ABC-type phosphate/phosphonate transport system substrate-binding protein
MAVGLMPPNATGGELPGRVRIGLPRSLFRDVPEPLVRVASRPFQDLLEVETGVQGELVVVEDAGELGKRLAENRVQVAVFQGYEFAWARREHPRLEPLVLAVNRQRDLRAVVLVRPGCGAAGFADLAGRSLAQPYGSRGHCRFFLERQCQAHGKAPEQFFSHITCPANAEDALDDVVDGQADAAVMDAVSLECYQRRKPGRCARLRQLLRSEVFPATVIAYQPGTVDDTLVQRFRDALLNAGQDARGRQMLTLWKLTGFETVPPDYERTLTQIAHAYPPRVGRLVSVPGLR